MAPGTLHPANERHLPYDVLQVLSVSVIIKEGLSKFNITYGGSLKLKTDYEVRVAATEELGKSEHWSSDGLHRHFHVLPKLFPRVLSICEIKWHISHASE